MLDSIPSLSSFPTPNSPLTCASEISSADLRRPIVKWKAYAGLREFKSPFRAKASRSPLPPPHTHTIQCAHFWCDSASARWRNRGVVCRCEDEAFYRSLMQFFSQRPCLRIMNSMQYSKSQGRLCLIAQSEIELLWVL